MIRLAGISRTYEVGGEPVHALVDVSEEIQAGEHLAIMGPSGSGKSTLLHVLGCLDRPDRGTYQLDGRDVSRLDEAELSLVRRHTMAFDSFCRRSDSGACWQASERNVCSRSPRRCAWLHGD